MDRRRLLLNSDSSEKPELDTPYIIQVGDELRVYSAEQASQTFDVYVNGVKTTTLHRGVN